MDVQIQVVADTTFGINYLDAGAIVSFVLVFKYRFEC